ncbi:MAG: PucR family transcriptional regulator [Anaerolineaceae bacterium]|nr:PucR family transcriptional regulator [Anaerolineaceae bacterium]
MSIKLSALSNIPSFGGLLQQVAGFSAEDCEISHVSIIDTPLVPLQLYRLNDNVFILSSFYLYKDNPAQMLEAVRNLQNMGASALGIKTDLYIQTVPQEVIKYCNSHHFPLFVTVKSGVPFRKLISVIEEQIKSGTGIDEILFNGFISGQAKNTYVNYVKESFPYDFLCMSTDHTVLFSSRSTRLMSQEELKSAASRLLETDMDWESEIIEVSHLGLYAIPCIVRNRHEAVFIFNIGMSPLPLEIKKAARSLHYLILLQIMETVLVDAGKKEQSANLISELLLVDYASESIARQHFVAHGLIDYPYYRILICSHFYPKSSSFIISKHIGTLLESTLRSFFPGSIIIPYNDTLIAIVPIKDGSKFQADSSFNRIVQQVLDSLTNLPVFNICYSELQSSFTNCRRIYDHLNAYCGISDQFSDSRSQLVRDFDLVSIALSLAESHQEQIVYQHVISPLIEYDKEYNYALIKTLDECWKNASLESASNALHIHSSTLRYRLSKIMEITGYNYFDQKDRTMLYIALTKYKMDHGTV